MVSTGGMQQPQMMMMQGGQQPPQQQQIQQPPPVVLDHHPSWKLHKNPFWRVKHPAGNKLAQVVPYGEQAQYQQQQQQYQQAPYGTAVSPQSQTSMVPSSPYEPVSTSANRHTAPIYVYMAGQDVHGRVIMRLAPGAKKMVEHLGVKVMFIGRIDMSVGIHEGKPHYDFISLSRELAPPSRLVGGDVVLPFKFRNLDMEFESYRGRNVSVRYIIKVLMERKFLPPVTKEHDLWVQAIGMEPREHEPIKMEVGIEDCLHIEFQYDRRMYHLQDIIRGKIHFLLVRIKIKHMELAVIRRETSGEGVAAAAAAASASDSAAAAAAAASANVDANNIFTETQTLVKYEIMDGWPSANEVIPVKLSLQGIPADLTPTYTAVNNRFSVRYFLNLVLVDEDDRRYFKQQEITLWRKELG